MLSQNRQQQCVLRSALLLCFVLGTAAVALGHPSPHLVTTQDLETIRQAIYMRLSPDGGSLAYVLENGDLWLIPTHPHTSVRRMIHGSVPIWSPDSKRVAYYSTKSGTLQLWVLDLKTGKSTQVTHLLGGIDPDPATRFSTWSYDILRYAWSPNGSKIVFCSRVSAHDLDVTMSDKNLQRSETNPAHPLVLTDTTPEEWTLQGVFQSGGFVPHRVNERGLTSAPSKHEELLPPRRVNQLFIVDLRTRVVRQLTRDDGLYFNPDWSPDGSEIVCVSSDGHPVVGGGTGTTTIYAINVSTAAKERLTNDSGVKQVPRYSNDGQLIAFLGSQPFSQHSVYVLPRKGGRESNLTAKLSRNVTDFEWSRDDASIVITYRDGVSSPIARVNVKTGDLRILAGIEAYRRGLTVSRTDTIVWVQSDPLHANTIYALENVAESPRIVEDINPQVHDWLLGKQEIVRWRNARGDELEGIIIKPVAYQQGARYPLIVDCYPGIANGFKGDPLMGNQALASRGYVVFYPDPRAPHTWVNPFKDEPYDHAAMGPTGWNVTFDDVMAGVDTLIQQGIVDPERMGLYGHSNGGAVVDQLIERTSRFKCAVSVAAAISVDWAGTFFLMTDNPIIPKIAGSTPWDHPESYVDLSAIYKVKNIETPLLLADGDDDGFITLTDIELYNGLRWFGKNVTFLRYPHQGHELTGSTLADFLERRQTFFDRYLKPRAGVTSH